MNYTFPYSGITSSASKGLLGGLLGGKSLNWATIISGTQKTLGLVNQAIPVIKQVTPMVKNAKTMFKVMTEFKKVDTPKIVADKSILTSKSNDVIINKSNEVIVNKSNDISAGPTFFV